MRKLFTATFPIAFITISASLLLSSHAVAESWVGRIQAPQYFAVSVEDVDKSVAWYTKALGLTKLDDKKADDGRWRIANLSNDQLFVEIIWDRRDGAKGRYHGIAKVGFSVPDIDAVADRVKEALGERPRVLDFKEHGIRILQLRDPDGNIIQLSTPMNRPEKEDQK
jgi:predicted enzyme related to lactoylglutathione lyase